MYDKYGEFDSAEEINRAAAAQLAEGDEEAILKMAEENGLDKGDAEDYIRGYTQELCTPLMAALGKIKVESQELEIFGVFSSWHDLLIEECTEDENLALAVRRRGKHLAEAMAAVLKEESKERKKIDPKIAEAAGIPVGTYISSLAHAKQKEILLQYYGVAPVQQEGA